VLSESRCKSDALFEVTKPKTYSLLNSR